ncbi:Gem-associated protein 2 like protein [Argiope bruennichi]|uniref:Gem-associated protein 2 like protein n=1 Tax=Argiope bruennichi TaxID=94029 RepID=A0A8T0ESU6_ARGBR|nr:Gem-associated protein 2 like protein [Argiope bruennichi]
MSGEESDEDTYPNGIFLEPAFRHMHLNAVSEDGTEYPIAQIVRLEDLKPSGIKRQAREFCYFAATLSCDKERALLRKKFPKKLKFPNNRPSCMTDWCVFCLGSKLCSKIYNGRYEEPSEEIEGHQPLLSIVVHFNPYRAFLVLKLLHKWFLTIGMEEALGSWIYSVLACIKKPLDERSKELLETLYNDCVQHLKNCDEQEIRRLRLIIAVLESYFDVNSN